MTKNPSKKLLVALVGGALVIAFFLTYTRSADIPGGLLDASVIEVKNDSIVRESAPATKYSDTLAAEHLELTPENITWFTNYHRSRAGLGELKQSSLLDLSAQKKAADLFTFQYFDHHRPDGETSFDIFIDQTGYEFLKAGENLARGNFTTSRDVVDAWMASDGHRRNILDPNYRNIGVAIKNGSYENVKTKMFVQHFAIPKTDCPAISNSLKDSINDLKGDIADKSVAIDTAKTDLDAMRQNDSNYNNAVNAYNALVGEYNDMVAELQGQVTKYNKQVTRFESCLKAVL